MMTAPKHKTGWEDARFASLASCNGTPVEDGFMLDANEPINCPVCGARIKLVWDVRIEEVEP